MPGLLRVIGPSNYRKSEQHTVGYSKLKSELNGTWLTPRFLQATYYQRVHRLKKSSDLVRFGSLVYALFCQLRHSLAGFWPSKTCMIWFIWFNLDQKVRVISVKFDYLIASRLIIMMGAKGRAKGYHSAVRSNFKRTFVWSLTASSIFWQRV